MQVQELGVELAAGGLLWRNAEIREEIALVHRKRYNDWSLPKGKLDPTKDEKWGDTAVREVKEETGCEFHLREFADCISYLVDETPKVVLFWNMELIKEAQFESEEETDALRWVSVSDALEKLDYPDQQAVVARATSRFPPIPCGSRTMRKNWWGKLRSMGFWPRSSSHRRLSSELATYQIELSYLIARVEREQEQRESHTLPWAEAACSLLTDAQTALDENDPEQGWRCFLAANRLELFGLDVLDRGHNSMHSTNALRTKARSIACEADDKLESWRKSAVKDHLKKQEKLKYNLTVAEVYEASTILHSHFNNQYHKIGLLKRQSSTLAIIAVLTTIMVLLIQGIAGPLFGPAVEMSGDVFVLAVALFGVLGASVSGFLTLAKAGTGQKIPNQIVNSWVTFARPTIGAAAALVLFAFLQSGLLQIGEPTPELALVVAFVAGWSERLLDRAMQTVEA